MTRLSDNQGKLAVQIARKAVDALVLEGVRYEPGKIHKTFSENRGVFVTLEKYPKHELRGCIGFPEPVAPLINALIDSAISAASRDPRFNPVGADEIDELVVEVSILTPPEAIKVDDPRKYPSKIKVGRDGLIVSSDHSSGLLLPQVPVEQGWDETEFLSHTCWKAGLTPDTWLNPEVKIFSFQGQIWCEKEPHGEIVKKELK